MDALDLSHPLSSRQDGPPRPVGVPAPAGPARPRAPACAACAPALALPLEVSCLIFSFAPVDSFGAIALVCKAWARLVGQVLRLNKRKAEQYVQQGLVCMKTSNCPWDSLRTFRCAALCPPPRPPPLWDTNRRRDSTASFLPHSQGRGGGGVDGPPASDLGSPTSYETAHSAHQRKSRGEMHPKVRHSGSARARATGVRRAPEIWSVAAVQTEL